jgi:hypothetical protein
MEARLVLSLAGPEQTSLPSVVQPDFERVVLSKSGTALSIVGAGVPVSPDSGSASPVGLTPSAIRTAYGVGNISFGSVSGDGTGQTIAIVDAFDNPSLVGTTASNFATSDLGEFNSEFGLSAPPSFTKLNETGGTASLPATDPSGNWEVEAALDVEWAHAIAPAAGIVLIECNSAELSDMYQGVLTAAGLAGVSVISMSWGSAEYSGETSLDKTFTTPSGHQGVTFLGATGDAGAPGNYAAFSPDVVAVGGTTLTLGAGGVYVSESAWSSGGGGASAQETRPAFQDSVQSSGARETPDVSFDADPSTGVAVYDSYSGGSTLPWQRIGGTSLATPCWAALVAIADQGRVWRGGSTLDGPNQTLPALYGLPSIDFHDVTSGNNGNPAGAGYDEATGIGTPIASLLVPDLASYGLTDKLVITSQPGSPVTAGSSFGLSVAVESSGGSIDHTASGSMSLAIKSGPPSATLAGSTSATIENGVATFSGLVLTTAAPDYTLAATATGISPAATGPLTVSPAAPSRLVFTSAPSGATAGTAFAVAVSVEDLYGNQVTGASETVALALVGGPAGAQLQGTTSEPATSGAAAFNTVTLTEAASGYQIGATAAGLAAAITGSFSVVPAAAHQLAISSYPSSTTAGTSFGLSVLVEDQFGNQVTTSGTSIALALAAGPPSESAAVSSIASTSGGVANIDNLMFETAAVNYQLVATAPGLGSAFTRTFSVLPAAAFQLAIGAAPSSVIAGSTFGLSVLVEDPFGNQVTTSGTSITLSLAGGPASESSTVSRTSSDTLGLATFNALVLTTASSTYKIEATAAGLAAATTGAFAVSSAPASQLVITAAPPSVTAAGAPFAITVAIEDGFDNLVTGADGQASLSLASGPAGAALGGATALPAAGGLVAFTGLALTKAAGDYQIQAHWSGLSSAASPVFTITPGGATHLALLAGPPSAVSAGQAFNLAVEAQDQYGNLVPTFKSGLAASLAHGAGALSGTTTGAFAGGSATISGLALDTAGSGFDLALASPGLPVLLVGPLTVTPAVAARAVIQSQPPARISAGRPFGLSLVFEDPFGNETTAFDGSVAATLTPGKARARLAGTAAAHAEEGVATFTDLIVRKTGRSFTLNIKPSGLPALTSTPFAVTKAAPKPALLLAHAFRRRRK